MKANSSLKNLIICESTLKAFKQNGKNMPKETLYKFIEQSKRQALRRAAFFHPLQEMMIELTPILISDKFLSSKPKLLNSTAQLYTNLNIYSGTFMSHIYQVLKHNIRNRIVNNQVRLDALYRPFVQLNQYRYTTFLKEIRYGLVEKIAIQCSLRSLDSQKLTSVLFLRKIQRIHILIRIFLLDKQTKAEEIIPVIETLQKYFDYAFRLGLININQEVTFQNSAAVYELYKVFNLTPKNQYKQFLQTIFSKVKKYSLRDQSTKIKTSQRQRKGQSVFQMRFQKSLHFHGYWFENNINIGLSEYDIVIKGRRQKEYLPFQGLNLADIKNEKWQKINKQQSQQYQKMSGLWHIPSHQKFKEDIVVNLNGPYHYTVGEKRELTRSQTIKRDLLRIYGYSQYQNVDYKDWQRQVNVLDTQQFFEKLTNK